MNFWPVSETGYVGHDAFAWIKKVSHYVLTACYPCQRNLNYKNPRVFNEIIVCMIGKTVCPPAVLTERGVEMAKAQRGIL